VLSDRDELGQIVRMQFVVEKVVHYQQMRVIFQVSLDFLGNVIFH